MCRTTITLNGRPVNWSSCGAFRSGDALADQTCRQAVRQAYDDVPALRCGAGLLDTMQTRLSAAGR